jgi:hypothetical protein
MFAAPSRSLAEVHRCTRGVLWRKCSLNDGTVWYFSEIKVILGIFWNYNMLYHLCKTLLRIWSKWQGHLKAKKVVLRVCLVWLSGTCCAAVYINNVTKPKTTSQFLWTVAISVHDSVGTAVSNFILCHKSCIACISHDNVTSKRHLRIIMCNSGSVEVLAVAAVAVRLSDRFRNVVKTVVFLWLGEIRDIWHPEPNFAGLHDRTL